ncbi:VanZ family protein [Microbacterium yannicii]|uniref:VanZ family protein n=1 Tax=Microbacterium yannicii TaxID=671622 RepID=UPI0002EE0AD7|nr:VanZ family protein [Microbacterium yannicii]
MNAAGDAATGDTAALVVVPTAVRDRRMRHDARRWLVAYVVALTLIALWPTPVDRGAAGLLSAITRTVPWLTYDVIETAANVVLFVPFGVLLTLVRPRSSSPWWVLGIALAATVAIELAQAVLLPERTPSERDVLANLCGAAIGLGAVLWLRRQREEMGLGTSGDRVV